jgi:hypothetical protein
MKRKLFISMVAMIVLFVCFVHTSIAQYQDIKNTFVRPGRGVPGMLYEPVSSGAKSTIGVFVMHPGSDYLQSPAGPELSKRGYTVLCANNTTDDYEEKVLAVKTGVEFLRNYPGIRKVVLFGHSGGSGLMTTYQNIAENGVKVSQGPEKIFKFSDMLADLPPADGIMLIDPNWGDGAMMLFSLDPAIVDEAHALELNQELNLFNTQHGFNPKGATYTDEFIGEFQMAQGKRNNRLIGKAQERLEAINNGKGMFNDDEPFVVPGARSNMTNNKLFPQDIRLMSHTRNAWPLVHHDGTITTAVIYSVRVPKNLSNTYTPLLHEGALNTTVHRFLKHYALSVTENYGYDEHSVYGIDWSSSNTCPPGNVKGISVPLLVMGMTGSWEYLSAETIYLHAKSTDKTIAFVEGANHWFTTCKECEKTPGEFGDTQKTLFDYIDGWLIQKEQVQASIQLRHLIQNFRIAWK